VRLKPLVASRDPLGRGFEERWVVMLNGGYDPALVRGRVVWMLDVWTGKVVWRYRDADFKAMRGDAAASMLPVAASIAMSDIGEADQPSGTPQSDTYFDTATWTDVGGNLFVARLHEIGDVDAGTGLVKNWTAARAFEPNRQATDAHLATGRGEAFYMTGNVLDRQMRLVTTFGTGHRDNLMQKTPACGPGNLTGCCASGCTVTTGVASSTYGAGSCTQGGTFQCSGGTLSYTPSATSGCGTQASPHACTAFSSSVTLTFDCGAAGAMGPMTAQLSCGADGVCTTDAPFTTTSPRDTTSLGRGLTQYRFLSVWSYGRTAAKRFVDAAGAKLFEAERFTDVPFTKGGKSYTLVETSAAQLKDNGDGKGVVLTCRGGATTCGAQPEDPGWMYTYGRWCPAKSCTDTTWRDERTGGAAFPFMGCITWSTFRPTGAVGGTDPCSASADNPTAFAYLLNMETGQPDPVCGFKDDSPLAYYGATVRDASAPPQNPSMRIGVNKDGQVNYSTLRIETGSGASKTDLGTRQNVGELLYWLEVPREVHTCRHVDATTCK
jgi:type IV pilus assembly protein PilY1